MAEGTRTSWLRRLRLPLLLLAALVALLALLPQLLLPWVERSATDALRTRVDVGWIGVDDLALGKVAVRRVAVGDDAALTIARISVRPDLRELLRGRIVLERIEIDGLRGTVEQDANGRPALRGLPFPQSGTETSGRPVTVQEILLTSAEVTVIPPAGLRRQPIAVRLDELLLRQVPTADAGPAYQGELRGALDGVPVTAQARSDQTAAGTRIEAEAELRGAPVSSEQLVLPPGFESLGATADGRLSYVLDPQRKLDRLTVDLTLVKAKLAGAEKTALAADDVSVAGLVVDLAAGAVDLGRITVTAPRIEAALTADGLVYPGLVPALLDAGVAPPARGATRSPWRVSGGRIDASDGAIVLRRDDHRASLTLPSFSWRDIGTGKAGEVRLAARAASGGAIDVSGHLGIDPATLDATVALTNLALPELTALADLPLRLAQGSASGTIQVSGNPAAPRLAAVLDVTQLHTSPPATEGEQRDQRDQRILAVDRLATRFTVEPGPAGAVEIASLSLSYPYAMVQRDTAGIFPLDVLSPVPAPGTAPEPQAAPAPAPARALHITALTIDNGRIDFVDRTTTPPYWMGLSSATANVTDVQLMPAVVGQLDLSARQDELHPVRASAQRTGSARWQGKATLDGISLATLNPYLAPVLGYEAQTGSLTLDLDATLDNRKLSVTNAVSLEDVGLTQTGLDVIQRQTGVPLTVALSLLEDVGGEVALSIPVEIDTATGKYELGSFVSQAIGRAVLGALSSPLRWLGMLFGTDGPPHALAIDPIPFTAGSATLDDAGATRLVQVARILAAHADLDVILKAQVAQQDRDAVGDAAIAELAQRRVEAVRSAFVGARYGAPLLPARLIVVPWTRPANGALDAAPAVYVEVQSR